MNILNQLWELVDLVGESDDECCIQNHGTQVRIRSGQEILSFDYKYK